MASRVDGQITFNPKEFPTKIDVNFRKSDSYIRQGFIQREEHIRGLWDAQSGKSYAWFRRDLLSPPSVEAYIKANGDWLGSKARYYWQPGSSVLQRGMLTWSCSTFRCQTAAASRHSRRFIPPHRTCRCFR